MTVELNALHSIAMKLSAHPVPNPAFDKVDENYRRSFANLMKIGSTMNPLVGQFLVERRGDNLKVHVLKDGGY